MKLLAYDTSSEILTAALFDGNRKIAELESPSFTMHSSILVPSLAKLLKENDLRLDQMDVLAVGLGPGSFTGLRVGITTAKIFAYASKMKLIGVSSLEAIARSARGFEGEIAVILDAKKEKLYAAVYEINGSCRVILRPQLVKIDTLLTGIKKPRLFLGDGVPTYREEILKTKQCQVSETMVTPKASQIAERALELAKEKKWTNPYVLEPDYLHPRDCNVQKNEK